MSEQTITTDDSGRLARHQQQQAAEQRGRAEVMARARWIGATGARPRRVRKAEAGQAGQPRRVNVPMDGADVLATVAHFALDPRCPQCGGPVELKPGAGTTVDVHIQHKQDCKLLDEA
jgi:hypothetical protein